ncbi:Abi-alpha family protein [Flavobacterium rhizosphaerae]|uniref:Abi-alpha family protein n=1 Tax=Flavobacterium rhizosphaerae TaxID=3163298 RepID=A0ABW8YXT1_9FLAO
MGENKINITSSLAEKGLDAAKNFLGKLIGPAVEEVGLLIADPIRAWRFNNQLRILNKAEKRIKKQGISLKKISVKNLVPLLEYSSLEEDDNLQQMWVNLFVNYVDADKSYSSSVFPYILSQLSSREAEQLNEFAENNFISFKALLVSETELYNLLRLGLVKQAEYLQKKAGALRIKTMHFTNDMFYLTALGREFLVCCSNEYGDNKS